MRSGNRAFCVTVGALVLASCGTTDRPRVGSDRPASDLPVKIGPPYQVGGRTYVPKDERRYDATGYASWYGGAHRGRPTASGERFDPDAISAAHTTLPLPSYVAVTALDTGRTILVRVNDRGPFAAGRIIDLSQGAARLLGVERQGLARVRVRRVEPSEADRVALRAGGPALGRGRAAYAEAGSAAVERRRPIAAESGVPAVTGAPAMAMSSVAAAGADFNQEVRPASAMPRMAAPSSPASPAPPPLPWMDAPDSATLESAPSSSLSPPRMSSSLAAVQAVPAPQASLPGAVPAPATFFIQVAALADPDRADALASILRPIGPTTATVAGAIWRVRLGPYGSEADALSALARAQRAGYQDARLVRESAP